MKESSVRPMTEADIPLVDELRRLAGWNQTPEDWRRLVRLEPAGCFLAARERQVIGTATTTTYGRALAWIGMMLVHPDHRRQGLGTLLMRRALEYLRERGVRCVKLDATPAGQPVYERLGFIPEWTLTRWQRPTASQGLVPECGAADAYGGLAGPGSCRATGNDERNESVPPRQPRPAQCGVVDTALRPFDDTDWPAVDALDSAAFGVSRARLLRALAGQSQLALVWLRQRAVAGWGFVRPGATASYLGPVVCSSAEGGLSLVAGLLRAVENRPVFWDVPDLHEAAGAAARRFGFTPVRPLTRMRFGPDTVSCCPQAQFAIADPAVG